MRTDFYDCSKSVNTLHRLIGKALEFFWIFKSRNSLHWLFDIVAFNWWIWQTWFQIKIHILEYLSLKEKCLLVSLVVNLKWTFYTKLYISIMTVSIQSLYYQSYFAVLKSWLCISLGFFHWLYISIIVKGHITLNFNNHVML